jgi:hypothetical protein
MPLIVMHSAILFSAASESEPESPAVEEPMITAEKRITVKASGEKVIEERQKVEIDVSVTTRKETHRSTVESEFHHVLEP